MAEPKLINVAVKIVFTIVKRLRKFDGVAERSTRLKRELRREKDHKTLQKMSYSNCAIKGRDFGRVLKIRGN